MAKNNPFAPEQQDTTPIEMAKNNTIEQLKNAAKIELATKKTNPFNAPATPDAEVITVEGAAPSSKAIMALAMPDMIFDALDQFNAMLPAGTKAMLIPQGSEAVIVKMEFNPEVKERISNLELELKKIPGITSQADVEKANATLKKAKGLIKSLEAEGLVMRSGLKEKSDAIIAYERNVMSDLAGMVKVINDSIVTFQIADTARIKAINDKIEADKKEALDKANAEIKRKADIQNSILEFERNCINNIASATTSNIQERIKQLVAFNFDIAEMAEFLSDAVSVKKKCIDLFHDRMIELKDIERASGEKKAELEAAAKLNQEQADKDLAEKTEATNEAIQKEELIAATSVQQESELKVSMIKKQSGLSRPWTFDEDTIDLSLLPDEFKTYDKAKIKEAIKSGRYEIPGINIYQKHTNVSR